MGYSNGTVYKPVSVYDVQRALGVSSADVGTLCKSNRINKFSRYKPISYQKISMVTDSERASVNHGITVPDVVLTNAITRANMIDACANDWDYTKPSGTASSPYRLTDFVKPDATGLGYYHSAVPPIQCVGAQYGWEYLKGKNKTLDFIINFDLDPDESTLNLQATDFITGNMDLREWKFKVYIDGLGGLWGDSLYILDSHGEIQGTTVTVRLPTTSTGTYTLDVYVCMYRWTESGYEVIPLPKNQFFNNFPASLRIIDDAQQSGGGIAGGTTQEMFENVLFGYNINNASTFKTAYQTTDNGTAEYTLAGNGDLYVKMNLTNTSGSTSTIAKNDFELYLQDIRCVPQTMYNSSGTSVSSVNIPNNSTVAIYLYFSEIFQQIGSDWTYSNKNNAWSMDFKRNNATLFNCDFYCMKYENSPSQTIGWIQK